MNKISRQDARQQGLKRFFTGTACINGHVSERLVSNKHCIACDRVAHKAWRKMAAGRVSKARWRERHSQSITTGKKRFYTAFKKQHGYHYNTHYYHNKASDTYRMVHRLRAKFKLWLCGARPSQSITELIGCTPEEFRRRIERQFQPGMSWDNYGWGKGKWCIDHIYPLASFDPTNKQHQRQAWHYSNLRPLPFEKNEAKGSRVIGINA